MPLLIPNVLSPAELLAIQDALDEHSLFEDGKLTAGASASAVKNNLQAATNAQSVKGVLGLIEKAVLDHPAVKKGAYPNKLARITISRYETNMLYGPHIDAAFIDDTRTDLAFTLFLSNPDSYQGGELEIQKSDGVEMIKLPEGSLYLYPADTIHQVLPVKSGIRLAAVGWIQSRVRRESHRQILIDLQESLSSLPRYDDNQAIRLKLLKVLNNLERLWCD